MKKLLLCTLLAAALVMSGCNRCEGLIGDFAPWDIKIQLRDAVGNNLLNPDFEGNILTGNITATMRGQTYKLNGDEGDEPCTRATIPHWLGFRTDDEHTAIFGEFGVGSDWRREQVVIDWGDGRQTTLWFTLEDTGDNCDPNIAHILWLKTDGHPDGEVVSVKNLDVTIVR